MALTISLFQRPGSILFLDDDPDYLDMLGMVVPPNWQVELFSRPSGFAERMRQEPARWEADAAAQLHMLDRWRQGQPLMPQILDYWANTPSRYQLAKACVIDYAMPGTNGLHVLETLLDWPGSRVLLTGQADEQVAVKAFNSGLGRGNDRQEIIYKCFIFWIDTITPLDLICTAERIINP
mgnify:CR=1 FL=1